MSIPQKFFVIGVSHINFDSYYSVYRKRVGPLKYALFVWRAISKNGYHKETRGKDKDWVSEGDRGLKCDLIRVFVVLSG